MNTSLRPALLACLAALLASCASPPRDTLYQNSAIDALLAGVYDGDLTCRDLLRHGDFGIGTFHRLDGEMIVLDGALYQVRSDGRVHRPAPATPTPFAAVCRFSADQRLALAAPADMKQVEARLDALLPRSNHFHAVRIDGRFRAVKTRSVPAQSKPYPPLKSIAATQPVFDMENLDGTIVGFRCPPYVGGLNVPGWHLHFLSADRTRGGHVLAFQLESGLAQLDTLSTAVVRLPENAEGFDTTNLAKDRSGELKAVEK